MIKLVQESSCTGNSVIVHGASLLAAKALSRNFRRVTLVERDALPDRAADAEALPWLHVRTACLSSGYLPGGRLYP